MNTRGAYWKDIQRSFLLSKSRAVSIVFLMLLGSFSFVGLKISAPNIKTTGEHFFSTHQTADLFITNNAGLTSSDQMLLSQLKNEATIEYGYFKDVVIQDSTQTFRIFSLPETLSKYTLTEGEFPNKPHEIALISTYKGMYNIGDKVVFEQDKRDTQTLPNVSFTLTGFVNSSELLSPNNLGPSPSGNGELNGYAVVSRESFHSDVFMIARIAYTQLKPLSPFETAYTQNVYGEKQKLQQLLKKSQTATSLTSETTHYTVQTRREIAGSAGYISYINNAAIIDAVGNVFPIALYFVALLVTFTTMIRFVDEERAKAGILKSLGYTTTDVIRKFIIYGVLTSTIGTAIGIILGHTFLPLLIYSTYAEKILLAPIELHFYPVQSFVAFLLGLMSTLIPIVIITQKELIHKPSQLLLPKSPTSGSKIFLERITFLWSLLSFTKKVTFRNIFRYKQRMLMTIFGVAGSTALLFAGLSVRSSIENLNSQQFNEILKYDMIIAENTNLNNTASLEITEALKHSDVLSSIHMHTETATKTIGIHNDEQRITLLVPHSSDISTFKNYINLRQRTTQKEITLTDDGAIISEKLASLLNLKSGDTLSISNSSGQSYDIKISDISEMYTSHFIFLSDVYYTQVFHFSPNYNSHIVKLKNTAQIDTIASQIMDIQGVQSVLKNSTLKIQVNTLVEALNQIMYMLIIVSILLTLVILYNLTQINIAERIRELSTIKVLGFHNHEVTLYIYRETIYLSSIGIIGGLIFGTLLQHYMLIIIAPDTMMFNPRVSWIFYILPSIFIVLILGVLGYIVNKWLKKINMLDALKSGE